MAREARARGQQGTQATTTGRNILIVLMLLALWTLALPAHPGMMRGVMDVQWPMFQRLPITTYGERLWALLTLYATVLVPGPAILLAGVGLYDGLRRRRATAAAGAGTGL